MILYYSETLIALAIASVPALVSIYAFFVLDKKNVSLWLLLLTALLLRLVAASLDPYLHEWDERFHALVAKNMMDYPIKPMMRVNPIMDYDYRAWCCNHIWVHKQPLFLWQMAASMKLFGVSEVTMRIPSVVMGTVSVYFVHELARVWTGKHSVAFLSALLAAFSLYQLELTSGRFGLEHNDLAMMFYVTAGFWAFARYLESGRRTWWAVLVGLFVGCAVLNKWLTGLLVFGGWGFYVLMNEQLRSNPRAYLHIALSVLVAAAVALPWQLYIANAFPLEASWTYELNRRHITEVLDEHHGSVWYHFEFIKVSYGVILIPFALLGVVASLTRGRFDRRLSISLLSMVSVTYLFFSIIVATKMPALVYPVASLLIIYISIGFITLIELFSVRHRASRWSRIFLVSAIALTAICALRPWSIAEHRKRSNDGRNARIHNTNIYKSLKGALPDDIVVLNCKGFEETDLMFYTDYNAYSWYPSQNIFDSLRDEGHSFAVFKNHGNQQLPTYIADNEEVRMLNHPMH